MHYLKPKASMSAADFREARTAMIDYLVLNHAKLKPCPRGYMLGLTPLNHVAQKFNMPTGTAIGIAEAVLTAAAWFKK